MTEDYLREIAAYLGCGYSFDMDSFLLLDSSRNTVVDFYVGWDDHRLGSEWVSYVTIYVNSVVDCNPHLNYVITDHEDWLELIRSPFDADLVEI